MDTVIRVSLGIIALFCIFQFLIPNRFKTSGFLVSATICFALFGISMWAISLGIESERNLLSIPSLLLYFSSGLACLWLARFWSPSATKR